MFTGNMVGQLQAFDETSDDINVFSERLVQYFIAKGIEEADPRRAAFLLTSISNNTYRLLQDLCFPSKPSEKKFDELIGLLKQHLEKKRSIFAERFKFHRANQGESEGIQEWSARVKGLAVYCNFGQDLEIALRDRFIVGLKSVDLLNRLFKEPDSLTYNKAVEIAVQAEAARANVNEMKDEAGARVIRVHRVEGQTKNQGRPKDFRGPRQEGRSLGRQTTNKDGGSKEAVRACYACGVKGHFKTDCKYASYKCKICKSVGHLAKVCKKSVKDNAGKNCYWIDEKTKLPLDPESEVEIFNLKTDNKQPFMLPVIIGKIPLEMEIDSGSGVSTISKELYCKYFKNYRLNKSNVVLVGYTKSRDRPVGVFRPVISYDGLLVNCDIHVVANGGPPLLGRDMMSLLSIRPTQVHFLKDEQVRNTIFEQFAEVFKPGLGTYKYAIVSLKLKPEAKPIFMKPRPLPFAFMGSVEKELARLEKEGIITPIEHSEWGTPLVPVLKSDGSLRICADYKLTVNRFLEESKYPLPRIEELFAKLQGGVEFTKLDLSQAYNQLVLDEQSKSIAAWSTHKGVFRVNRLPFGVTPAAAKFQKMLEQLLQGVEGVVNYLDDIVITGRNREEHVSRLKAVLERMEKAGLRLRRDKCQFFVKEVCYLGHIIDREGLRKSGEKVKSFLEAKPPSSVNEVKSFIGMVGYYGKFIPNLAELLRPLYDLQKKNVPFEWTLQCQKVFEQLKEYMGADTALAHYDPQVPIKLSCDASSDGIGAVLTHQYSDRSEKPIAYIARTLTSAERNYSMIEKEALAIFFAVKRLHQYVYGRRFTLVTDHKPLLAIFGPHKGVPVMAAGRLQRWALFLSGYQYDIEGIKGDKNYGPDYLSRSSPDEETRQKEGDKGNYLHFMETTRASPINCKDIGTETRRDPVLSRVRECIEQGWPDSVESDLQPYFRRKTELTLEQNCIMWGFRVVVPTGLREILLEELHAAHPGIVKTKATARSFMWWPSIDKQIEDMVRSCRACTVNRQEPNKAALIPWQQTSTPWERVHLDYLGPFRGKMYLLVVDSFTKWPEVVAVGNANAESTVEKLRELFARFGLPKVMVTDNGTQFTGQPFQEFATRNGIKHTCTPPAHPATNGLAENGVKQFKQALHKALACPKNVNVSVHTLLARFLLSYRNSIHGTTNESPAKLMLGRPLRVRLSQLKPSLFNTVKANQEKQVTNFKGQREAGLEVGQQVAVRDYRTVNKKSWSLATVETKQGPRVYWCRLPNGQLWKRHIDQIWSNVGEPGEEPHPLAETGGEDEYSAETAEPAPMEPETGVGGGTQEINTNQRDQPTKDLMIHAKLDKAARPKRDVKPPQRLDL